MKTLLLFLALLSAMHANPDVELHPVHRIIPTAEGDRLVLWVIVTNVSTTSVKVPTRGCALSYLAPVGDAKTQAELRLSFSIEESPIGGKLVPAEADFSPVVLSPTESCAIKVEQEVPPYLRAPELQLYLKMDPILAERFHFVHLDERVMSKRVKG